MVVRFFCFVCFSLPWSCIFSPPSFSSFIFFWSSLIVDVVEMDVLWRRCSVQCRMYERLKEELSFDLSGSTKIVMGDCVFLCLMTRWGIVTVPGFPHAWGNRTKGARTHDSESPAYLLNLSPSDNLRWPDTHPSPWLSRWLYRSPPLPLRTDPQLPRWQPGALARAAPKSRRV